MDDGTVVGELDTIELDAGKTDGIGAKRAACGKYAHTLGSTQARRTHSLRPLGIGAGPVLRLGIDMMKLIAAVTGEPLSHLLEMPEHYCQSCGMVLTPDGCGTDAAGATTDHYCKWCYDRGEYTYETTMEAMIEDCAPRLAQNTGMSLDEAVSLMGAVLPQLERWRTVQENEKRA